MSTSHDDRSAAPQRPRRPILLDPRETAQIPGEEQPELLEDLARRTAAMTVQRGRASEDPDVARRLVHLVEQQGIDDIAALWSRSPATTLPGALWRLYAMHDWLTRDPQTVATRYRLAVARTPAHEVVVGAASPAGPRELQDMLDEVLTGVYRGDLAVALERASAFCRILAAGGAYEADARDTVSQSEARYLTLAASALLRTAEELEEAARLWRAERLA